MPENASKPSVWRKPLFGAAAVMALAAWDEGPEFVPPKPFALEQGIGGASAGKPTAAWATSSRIAATEDGALAIDADSGWLFATDNAGAETSHVAIGADAGTLAYDPIAKRVYVADRRGDRIVAVDVGETLKLAASWKTSAEPYGIALTPDRKTLVVTAIADRALIAYDVGGKELWRVAVDAEPRGVAISADGTRAAIASLVAGGVDVVDLGAHRLERRAYAATDPAHGAFAVAYLGDHVIAAPMQTEQPAAAQAFGERYGGSELPPVAPAIAFVDDRRGVGALATTSVREPRAVTWDPAHDRMYIAGMASDRLVQITHASQVDPQQGATLDLRSQCGADGLALDAAGNVLVWCSFTRSVDRISTSGPHLKLAAGVELVPSSQTAQQHAGMVLFHTADPSISAFGAMSCGNCHVEGRSDGESWLIHGERLQTPMLFGRIANTAPYKWDGGAKDLVTSLRATIERLGGDGLSKQQLASLAAYLESTPPPRTPTRDPASVSRGKSLFDSAELGCSTCHDGPAYTDRERHALARNTKAFDTPSLVGIFASAPYFHDGSAPTLDSLLRDHGRVHGMSSDATSTLTDQQITDLTSFLETL